MNIFNASRLVARKFGLEVQRANYNVIDSLRLAKLLRTNDCRTVIDVGANVGQFAKELFDSGSYDGEIYSFEPLPNAYAQLEVSAQRYRTKGKDWRVAPRVALGAKESTTNIHVSGNSGSSSLAHMTEAHVHSAPGSGIIGHELIDVRPLSTMLDELDIKSKRLFLKLDTQGTEHNVLSGALSVIDRVAGIKIEHSVVELYHGQRLYWQMDEFLRGLGFELWDLVNGFRDPASAKMLQFDGIYFRPKRFNMRL